MANVRYVSPDTKGRMHNDDAPSKVFPDEVQQPGAKRTWITKQQWRRMSAEEKRADSVRMVALITKQLEQIERGQRYLLNPHGQFMLRWDVVIMVALLFTALVTPYEIALLQTKLDPLFFVNRLVDLIFTIDILVNFRLMFFEPKQLKLVKSRQKIANHYLRGWFLIDFLSVLPGYIDCFTISSEGGSNALEMTMVLRLIRLAKMGRIMKASRILVRWLTMVNIKNSGMTLLKNTMLLVGATHWMACAWTLILQFHPQTSHTWVNAWAGSSDVCAEAYSKSSGTAAGLPFANYEWELCHSPSELYTIALYWSFVNLVSGFAMWPTTQAEYVLCICVMAVGGYVWAYIIAHITAVAINVSYDLRTYQETMDQVNDFLLENKVTDANFARSLRKFVMFKRNQNKDQQTKDLLTKLSPGLGGECAKFGASVIHRSKVGWLRTIAEEHLSTMLQITLSFETQIFAPQEAVHRPRTLFLVCQGVCARDGQILIRSSSWGEDSLLLNNESNCFVYPAWTVTYVHLWSLGRERFLKVINSSSHIAVMQLVRKATIKLAVIRGLQVTAERAICEREQAAKRALTTNGGDMHADSLVAAKVAAAAVATAADGGQDALFHGSSRKPNRRGSGVWGKVHRKVLDVHTTNPLSPVAVAVNGSPDSSSSRDLQLRRYIDSKHEAVMGRMDRIEKLLASIAAQQPSSSASSASAGGSASSAPGSAVPGVAAGRVSEGPPVGLFPSI